MKNFSIRKTSAQPASKIVPLSQQKSSYGFKAFAAPATSLICFPVTSMSRKCRKAIRPKVTARLDKIVPISYDKKEHHVQLSITKHRSQQQEGRPEQLSIRKIISRQPSKLEVLLSDAVKKVPGDQAALELTNNLVRYYQEEFNQFLLTQYENSVTADSYMELVLKAANLLVIALVQAIQELAKRVTKSDGSCQLVQVASIAQRHLEYYIEPHIFMSGPITTLNLSDASKIISWVATYLDLAKRNEPFLQQESSIWNSNLDKLVQLYLQRGVRFAMNQCLESGWKLQQEEDIVENQDGKLVTGQSMEVAYMCNMQLSVAMESIPTHYLGDVVAACNEELREFAGQAMLRLGLEWKDMSVERLCSVINEASKIGDDIEERNGKYLTKDEHIKDGEDLCRDFTELALFATNYLSERIMLDMHHEAEPILSAIGNLVWENQQSVSAVQRTNATLSDYFEDLEGWLSQYFFPKVLKHCLDLSLERYLEAFFGNTMANGVKDPSRAAKAMRQDYSDFVGFWNDGVAAKYQGSAGFYSEQIINQRLHQLASFAFLMTPMLEPEEIQEEIKMVLSKFSADAVPVVLHLAGLRKRHNAVESMQWHEIVSKASMMSEGEHEVSYVYKLPDLRNSRFLQNIQPPRTEGMTCTIDMSCTSALVKKRNFQRVRGMARERVQKLLKKSSQAVMTVDLHDK